MNAVVQKALERLEKADYSGYFTEMSKITPDSLKGQLSVLRMTFIGGDRSWRFSSELKTFAEAVSEELPDNAGKSHNTTPTVSEANGDALKETAYTMLEDGNLAGLITFLMAEGRGKNWHANILAINVSYKRYESDRISGKPVDGAEEGITERLVALLSKI